MMKNKLKKTVIGLATMASVLSPTLMTVHADTLPQTSNQTTQVVGTFNAVTLNVSIPATSSFTYDPNTGNMTAQLMNMKNQTNAPVYMNVNTIQVAPTSAWTPSLIAPTTYSADQWKNLTKAQTSSTVALGFNATDSANWLNGIEHNNFWSTDLASPIKVGAIKANSDTNVQPTLKAGTALDSQAILTSNYVFEFGIN